MPLYGQRCKTCGHEFEDARCMADCDTQPHCPKCGAESVRDYAPQAWNGERPEQVSDALGVHPEQVAECVKQFPHHRFNKQGQMLFRTNGELQRVLKDLGFVDRNKH